MIDIVTAISRMDVLAEQAHQRVSTCITDRVDEILFIMEEFGYPGDLALEIATHHILLKQHEYRGKIKALAEVNRIVSELQSDGDFVK